MLDSCSQHNVEGTWKNRKNKTTRCRATRSLPDCRPTTKHWNAWVAAVRRLPIRPFRWSVSRTRFGRLRRSRRCIHPPSWTTRRTAWCRTRCTRTPTVVSTVCPSRSFWRLTTSGKRSVAVNEITRLQPAPTPVSYFVA